MTSLLGKTIAHYRVLEHLGGGGMGIVYKAQDLKLERPVALKFLPPELTQDPDAKQRFMSEARAASALQHPNICVVHDIDETGDGGLFISMEYLPGETLEAVIARGPLPIGQAVRVALQVARGLSNAHEHGIVHRDIKPANIIVTADGTAKILDFGIAKLTGSPAMASDADTTAGTAAYMSPEQVRGEEVDHRSDIWSLGVVLYEMLSGRRPFQGDHQPAVIYSILNEEPAPIRTLRPELPGPLENLVGRMLRKDPASRLSSMEEAARELAASEENGPARTRPGTSLLRGLARPVVILPLIVGLFVLASFTWWSVDRSRKLAWAHEKALVDIETLGKEEQWSPAFRLVRQVQEIIPDDPVFMRLKEWTVRRVWITSQPAGARILWQEYGDSSGTWLPLGVTPAENLMFPRGSCVLRFEEPGFDPAVLLVSDMEPPAIAVSLDRTGTVPDGMIHVPGGRYSLSIPGLEEIDSVTLADYFIDRFEVTNREYKKFLDAGGYQNRQLWKFPFRGAGGELGWEQAMLEFHDASGRPGPATWEVGSYPEGEADHPVCGISWYEAAAYAEFTGKSLPTIYHWNLAAGTEFSSDIVPRSNYAGKGTSPVGAYRGISKFGASDMAGNVREWCWNETGGKRFILGGGWNDQTYTFNDAYAQDPFDRTATNGFRCIRYGPSDTSRSVLEAAISVRVRDLTKEAPVSEETFRYFKGLYRYDKGPLAAQVEMTDSTNPEWSVEKISLNAAYGAERLSLYLFLPRRGKSPFQTVLFFPGSEAIYMRTSNPSWMTKDFDFILRDGRAVAYPVYKSTFERGDGLKTDVPTATSSYRDHVIMWVKDFSRSIDYLETRRDIDTSKLAYFGVSWGGALGAIVPAVEPRIRTVILYVAGLSLEKPLPEVDALNYVTRVTQPVLMLNGQYDHYFPVQTSMMPMFRLLGTPAFGKESYLYPTGHAVPRTQLITKTLAWLDRYLGPLH